MIMIRSLQPNNGLLASQVVLRTPTIQQTSLAATQATSTPPLPVRTALVATTTALATPACPVIGVVHLGLRYVVYDSQTRYALLGATTLVGGVFTLINFATRELLPVVYAYGQLFLPFALVNGGLASVAYVGLDLALGTARLARLPWTGAAMGAFVGLVGPISGLYDHAFQWCYAIPEADGWFTYLLNNSIMLPISIATGASVGLLLHPLLYFPIVGIPGVHWAKFSLPLLAAATAGISYLYGADYYNPHLFPPETYLTSEEKCHLGLVPRFHAQHLQVEDWSLGVGYRPRGTGVQARESVASKLEATQSTSLRTDKVFDSRRKAWLHYVTNGLFGDQYAVESVPSEMEIHQQAQRYLLSDCSVAFILLHQNDELSKEEKLSIARQGMVQLATELQPNNRKRNKTAKLTVDRMELASHGMSLLFTQRKQGNQNNQRLEQNIRKLVPGILLYTKDEPEGSEGCSVESQLEALGWTGNDEQLHQHRTLWKRGLHQFLSVEQAEANARQLTWAVTALGVVLLYGFVGGN